MEDACGQPSGGSDGKSLSLHQTSPSSLTRIAYALTLGLRSAILREVRRYSSLFEQCPRPLVYAAIALVIVAFNIAAVVGLKALLSDDQAMYYEIGRGNHPWLLSRRAVFLPLIHIPVLALMHSSPLLARLLIVVLLMVPISCMFYYLYTKKLGIGTIPAFSASVLPNILPGQELIPSFVDGSYCLYSLFFVLLAVLLALRYLDRDRDGLPWLAAAVLTYFASSQLMEQSAFLFPPVAFLLALYSGNKRRKYYLIAAFLLISVLRILQSVLNPWGDINTPHYLGSTEILQRIGTLFLAGTPLSALFPHYYSPSARAGVAIGLLLFVIGLGLLVTRNTSERVVEPRTALGRLSKSQLLFSLWSFFLIWFLSAAIVFVAVAKHFPSRYAYLAAFGICAALCCSLYGLLLFVSRQRKALASVLLLVMVVSTGYRRHELLSERFAAHNESQAQVTESLSRYRFPPGSQIVLLGITGEYGTDNWLTSSGYLQHALGRANVQGLLGRSPTSFYNPFDHERRGWRHRMAGLDLRSPIFLFKYYDGKTRQYQYALQWIEGFTDAEGLLESEGQKWNLLRFDRISGVASMIASGTTYTDYREYLDNCGGEIRQEDVLWGEGEFNPKLRPASPMLEGFRIVSVSSVAKITSDGNKGVVDQVQFGDAFSLSRVSLSPSSPTRGKRVSILWRSKKSQRTGDYSVGYEVRDVADRRLWSKRVPFLSRGVDLAEGDFVYGEIAIPKTVVETHWRNGCSLIIYFLIEDPGDWSGWPKMLLRTSEGTYNVSVPLGS